jgi:hypothetical protein
MRRHVMLWSVLALAGCGSSEPGRTSGGIATGAGTGAVIGLIGGPIGVVVGAAVGAGAGALAATNTAPSAVNLGDPLWVRSPGAGSTAPPQPLQTPAAYGAPPSPGASPMPLSAPIQSQPLPPAQ